MTRAWMCRATAILKLALCGILFAIGSKKMLNGHSPVYAVGELVYYGAAVAEIVVGILLFTRWASSASLMIVIGACAAIVWHLHVPQGTCGCLGNTSAERSTMVWLICGIGALGGVIGLHLTSGKSSLQPKEWHDE